jgi:hypothetical protein
MRLPHNPFQPSEHQPQQKKMIHMKKFGIATMIATSMTAAVLGLAAPAQAAMHSPAGPSYSVDNHDEVTTTNGFVDQAF